jgi:hypothetical protein
VPESCANSNGRARVSKDEDGPWPSCFETPRYARLLSMRGITILDEGHHDRASGMFCKAGLWPLPVFVLFRPVIGGATHATPPARISRLHPAA